MAFQYWCIIYEYGNGTKRLCQIEWLHVHTDPIKYNPSWANSVSNTQAIPCLQYDSFNKVHNSPPPGPVFSQMCPSHMTPSYNPL